MNVRDTFFNNIYKQICNGADYYIVSADLAAPSLDDLRRDFPDRFISVGIAEQSLISVSSGLLLSGHKVIAYGLGPFPITRAYDQVRSIVAEMNLPLVICVLNAGLCSAESGFTHLPIDDMATVRALPNIDIYNPTDETVSKMIAESLLGAQSPMYIRFDKSLGGRVYSSNDVSMADGFTVYGDRDAIITIISFGYYVPPLRRLIDEMVGGDVKISLIDMFKLKPNENKLIDILADTNHILTVEENSLMGGIGSYILELLNDTPMERRIQRMGLQNMPYQLFVNREYVQKDQKIDISSIKMRVQEMIAGLS